MCVRINAIQVGGGPAFPITLDYRDWSCGWATVIPSDSTGIADAVVRMLYVPGACSCQ